MKNLPHNYRSWTKTRICRVIAKQQTLERQQFLAGAVRRLWPGFKGV